MKVILFVVCLVALSYANHNELHSKENPTAEDIAEETNSDVKTNTVIPQSRHHDSQPFQASYPTAAAAIMIPYPAFYRAIPVSQPAPGLPIPQPAPVLPVPQPAPVVVVPVLAEDPTARLGVGGGLSGNLGPLSAGFGAGAGTNGLGGGFNVGLGGTGLGANANFGFTPSYAASTPAYNQYYNQYYTPTSYYSPSPASVYYPATTYPAAYGSHFARTIPQLYHQPLHLVV